MNEHNAIGTRVVTRPVWVVFLFMFLTSVAYRGYWMWRTNEDLRVFGRRRPVAMPGAAEPYAPILVNPAASAATVLLAIPGWTCIWFGALPWGASFAPAEYGGTALAASDRGWLVGIGVVLLTPAFTSILRTRGRIRRARALAGLPRDTVGMGAAFVPLLALELAAVPAWLFAAQHALNDLWSHYPTLLDEDLYGELAPPPRRAAAIAERPTLHEARLRRVADELEQPRLLPVTTLAFAFVCVAAFVWQVTQHGFFPSEIDIERVGGLREGLDGMWWRFWSANVLHGGVDHLLGNLTIWLIIATMVERVVGHARMALLVVAGAAGCSIGALVAHPDEVGIGASGVVFAAFGLAAMVDPFARRSVGRFGWLLVALGLGLSTFVPGISSGGHVGGLLAGFAVGGIAMLAWKPARPARPIDPAELLAPVVDRTAPLAPDRELSISERLAHLATRRDAGALAPGDYERLRGALMVRG